MLDNLRVIFPLACLFSLSKKGLAYDTWCDSYYDDYNIFHGQQFCYVGAFCCGTCKNRFCCTDGTKFMNQSSCSSTDLPWWLIGLIILSCLYLLYCVFRVIKTICSKPSQVGNNRHQTRHLPNNGSIARLFSSDPSRASSTRSSQSTTQSPLGNNYVSYGSNYQHNHINPNLFQQDAPPAYDTLKLDAGSGSASGDFEKEHE